MQDTDEKIFTIIGTLLNRIFARYVQRLSGQESKSLIATVKELIAMVSSNLLVSLPYFLSYSHHSSDKLRLRDIRKAFDFQESEKLLLVTDTFFEINGVARTISRMIDEAMRRDRELCVVTCLSKEEEAVAMKDARVRDLVARRRLKIFPSVAQMDLPEYEGLQVRLLPFLELLQ
ncbi:MAG: hypothetical protein KDC48_24305, partial [Planctomycetes bacterium]|nr:hypothetical protein [Planctomycetota bacterium]